MTFEVPKKRVYTMIPHVFVFNGSIGKSYCSKCGLISSNNPFTQWAIQKGCDNQLHQAYSGQRSKHTALF